MGSSGSSTGSSGEDGGAGGGASGDASAASIFAPGEGGEGGATVAGESGSGGGERRRPRDDARGAELSQGNFFFRVSSGYQRVLGALYWLECERLRAPHEVLGRCLRGRRGRK